MLTFEFKSTKYNSMEGSSFHVTGPDCLTLPPIGYQDEECALPSLHDVLGGLFNIHSRQLVYPSRIRKGAEFTLVNHEMLKRPRRRYHEVQRVFKCGHPSCTKSYGALNHLNAHIKNMDHGPRRRAKDFAKLARILPFSR
ncbi:hypothetical protein DSO57_1019956 [Entomophthora muscae]|uniref:Uncharacterized protein n=1 Tax=Entomophthora muscae TaxID=34485 RepID=A0ACC2TRG0_9FUNG|nr:hypothetical protein DSO57_1019956 [Entomophthora muscae]